MSKFIIISLFVIGILFPVISNAQYLESGSPRDSNFQLVPCDGVKVPCDFNALMELLNRFMNFILYMSIPLAAISISYAGYLYISAAGDPGKIENAHKIFGSVVKGFVFVLAGWLIVYSIMSALLGQDFMNSKSNLLRGGNREGSVNMNNTGGSNGVNSNYSIEDYNRDSGNVTKRKDLQYYYSQ
jgi:Type IV secretion system pilin